MARYAPGITAGLAAIGLTVLFWGPLWAGGGLITVGANGAMQIVDEAGLRAAAEG